MYLIGMRECDWMQIELEMKELKLKYFLIITSYNFNKTIYIAWTFFYNNIDEFSIL